MAAPWDCMSCGARAETKPYCEQCGAAMPLEGTDDSALSLMLGLVCERCDGYNDPGVATCVSCHAPLADVEAVPPAPSVTSTVPPSWLTPPSGKPLGSQIALPKVDIGAVLRAADGGVAAPRELAATTPCVRCGSRLGPADKFCRECGQRAGEAPPSMTTRLAPMSPAGDAPSQPHATLMMSATAGVGPKHPIDPSPTLFFGRATAERSAKLLLVRGQSQFGSQWRLQAAETVVGRSVGAVLFPDDAALAHEHCKLVFRGSGLWLEPAPSTNGVFLRVREPAALSAGDEIVVGAQRVRVLADDDRLPIMGSADDTRILGSLTKPTPPISLLRVAPDPTHNEVFHRCQRLLTIGRAHCDVNFPGDTFVSERHAQISRDGDRLMLQDLRSRNGTYLRLRGPHKLQHADLILLGDKVLRVELPRV